MRHCLCLILALGCTESGAADRDGGFPAIEPMNVTLRLAGVSREDTTGRMRGIDLDGRASDATDELGCFQQDFTDSLRGQPGVDNQYYVLVLSSEVNGPVRPPDEPTTDELIAAAAVTVPLELASVRTGLEVRLGVAEPQIVPVEDGHFQALTGSMLRFTIGGFPQAVHGLAVSGLLTPEGELTDVVVAGAVDIDELITSIESIAPDIDPTLVRTTLEGVADLDPGDDGRCRRVSAAFTVEVEPAL